MTVHVVGNVCIDTTFQLSRFPRPGETMNALSVSEGLGGKGANQAVAAWRTGAAVLLWAAVGSDSTAEHIREALAAEGLGLGGLVRVPQPSDRSSILVDSSGENLIVSAVPSAASFDPIPLGNLEPCIAPGDVVVLQGNLDSAVTDKCLALAKARGATTILNASPLDGSGMDVAHADLVIVNAIEAEILTGHDMPEAAASALVGRGPRHAVVTLGRGGALIAAAGSDGTMRIPAPAVTAIDTSGAGDVFCGVVAGRLAAGESVEAATRLAVRAAAIAVTRSGTLRSCPSAAEISHLLATSRSGTRS